MILLCALLAPILGGVAVSAAPLAGKARKGAYLAVLAATDLAALLCAVFRPALTLFPLTERLRLRFSVDGVGIWFLCLTALLYTLVFFYALEYLEDDPRARSFFAFYFASMGAMSAVCLAGNLLSLYLSFELATLTSMPMVAHDRTKEAVNAALKYLFYSIGGALLGLFAVLCLCYYAAGADRFVPGGFLAPGEAAGNEALLRLASFLGIVGFGAKAGMYPLHGWLPTAHPVAPAPASALLSGIIAKAGILAVIRLVYFSVGTNLLRGSWVQSAWMGLAMVTVLMGSMMAYREGVTKKRLAYSTVSQISYIMLGLSVLSPAGLAAGLIHAAAHAVSKGALFLCAGVFIHKLGLRNAADLGGVGYRMPLTVTGFLFASLSLVGIPPMGGFTSKWFLASAALSDAPAPFSVLIPAVLLLSALLTAGYLFSVVVTAFFPAEGARVNRESAEPTARMTAPILLLCAAALAVGLFGGGLAALCGI